MMCWDILKKPQQQNHTEKYCPPFFGRQHHNTSVSQKMNVSFYRCVTQHRLIAAKRKIVEGQPLESIYSHLGFSDYFTFYHAFKGEYGISPRQFRKI